MRCVSQMQQKDRSCFLIQSVILCYFVGELGLLLLNIINKQYLLSDTLSLLDNCFRCLVSVTFSGSGETVLVVSCITGSLFQMWLPSVLGRLYF